jgi:hypothetical protein
MSSYLPPFRRVLEGAPAGWKDTARKMRASQPTFVDQLRGTGRVIRREGLAGGMSPFKIRRASKQVRQERLMGSGAVGGDRNWRAPVHATLDNGRPITISYGTGSRRGEYLVADGHVSFNSFYSKASAQRHDHFKNGKIVKDRGASS